MGGIGESVDVTSRVELRCVGACRVPAERWSENRGKESKGKAGGAYEDHNHRWLRSRRAQGGEKSIARCSPLAEL